MNTGQKIIKNKVGLLNLSEMLPANTDNRIRVREQLRLFTSFEPTAVLHRTRVEQPTSCRTVDDQERRATFAMDGALITMRRKERPFCVIASLLSFGDVRALCNCE